jgi:hypothetical protein
MKAITRITLLFSLLITVSCVPDSLTEFKEDAVQKVEVPIAEAPSEFVDSEGNEIDATVVNKPTELYYAASTVVTAGTATRIEPFGSLGDLTLVSGSVAQHHIDNLGAKYSFSVDSGGDGTGISIDTSGVIIVDTTSPYPEREITVRLTFFDPVTGTAATPLTETLKIIVQAPVPESFHVTYTTGAAEQNFRLTLDDVSGFTTDTTNNSNVIISSTGGEVTSVSGNDVFVKVDSSSGTPNFKVGDEIKSGGGGIATIQAVTYLFTTTDNFTITPTYTEGNPLNVDGGDGLIDETNTARYQLTNSSGLGELGLTPVSAANPLQYYIDDGTLVEGEQTFTMTVLNDISSKSYTFTIAIIDAPTDLAMSDTVAFSVSDASKFKAGTPVAGNFSPPLTSGGKGVVKKVIDVDGADDIIIVKVSTGEFLKDQSIDDAETYNDGVATINDVPTPLTSIIETPTEITSCARVTQGTTAVAPVNRVATAAGPVYYMFLIQGMADITTDNFSDADSILQANAVQSDGTTSCVGGDIAITSTWAESVKLTLSSVANFDKGDDIISDPEEASGYVTGVTAGGVSVYTTTPTEFLIGAGNLDHIKPFGDGTPVNITDVEPDVVFELEFGNPVLINPYLTTGSGLTYSISPDLPAGLELNTSTGVISGTPNETSSVKTYTLTAENVISSASIQFKIRVSDYFEITSVTPNAPDFILHRSGQANEGQKCRINKEDILSGALNMDAIDISCFLEAGELELFSSGLVLTSKSGPGVCEFTTFQPYSYYKAKPINSTSYTDRNAADTEDVPTIAYIKSNTCTGAGTLGIDNGSFVLHDSTSSLRTETNTGAYDIDSGDVVVEGDFSFVSFLPADVLYTGSLDADTVCAGIYKQDNGGTLNCDEGSVQVVTVDITEDEGGEGTNDCKMVKRKVTIDCGGQRNECLSGPIVETPELELAQSTDGIMQNLYPTDGGATQSFNFSAPLNLGFDTNIYLANFTNSNSCNDAALGVSYNYYENSWNRYGRDATGFYDPFHKASPFYTFNCLDAEDDIVARVRVMVRDWNRAFSEEDLIDDIIAGGTAGAGAMDDLTADNFDDNWNDRADWDDRNTAFPTDITGCGADTAVAAPTANLQAIVDTPVGQIAHNPGQRTFDVTAANLDVDLYQGDTLAIVIGATTHYFTVDYDHFNLSKSYDEAVDNTIYLKEFPDPSLGAFSGATSISVIRGFRYPVDDE